MGTRRIDLESVRACARPTAAQQHEFIEHLCYAHSWYKHVPLAGADFVVFLGEGERYGRGVDIASYRRLCGALDYAWRFDAGPYRTDSGEVEIAPEIVAAGSVRLSPWCSNDLAAPEVLVRLHAGRIGDHPRKADLAALFSAEARVDELWAALPPELREAATRFDVDTPAATDERVVQLVDARRARDVCYRTLRAAEVETLARAIAAVVAL